MPDTTIIPAETAAPAMLAFRQGRESPGVARPSLNDFPSSILEGLPGAAIIYDQNATGEELGRLFAQEPDLPGVIFFDEQRFLGIISQAHYYKCISRAFGREIYHRRPAVIMLADITVPPLILSSECPVPNAVEQCLGRPADFVYEPFLVQDRASGQYRLCAFQVLLLASSRLASLRNRQMEQILNSVTDGLLVIDKNFRIGGEYSRVVGKIFERTDLRDVPLPEVFQPLVDTTTHEQLKDYLKILFDPKLIDRLIKPINPAKQLAARFPALEAQQENRTKHFSLNFERIRTQAEITQVLVRIEDITQRINLAKELELQEVAAEEKLQLVMQVLQVEPVGLNRFLARFGGMLAVLAKLFESPNGAPPSRDAVHSLFRQAHTLKGEASLLQLTIHARALHQLEDQLEKCRSATHLEAGLLAAIRSCWETLQKLSDQIRQTFEQWKNFGAVSPEEPVLAPAPTENTRSGLIETLTRLIADLSDRLGKPAAFHTTAHDRDLPESYRDILHEILIHLARNSMVHGIEPVAERIARGKNAHGFLQLELKSHPDFHEIIFQDDGNGLDYDKIRQRAGQLGVHLASEEDLRQVIFAPGFSTAETVTELAGRGVGLDIVVNSLREAGGRIIPYSGPGAYCAFQILLPKISVPLVA